MIRLIGTFQVKLPCRLYISGPKTRGPSELSFHLSEDGFDIDIHLSPDETPSRETETLLIWCLTNVEIIVARDSDAPPAYPHGNLDTSEDYEQELVEYNNFFMSKLEPYSLVGAKYLNRLLRFFRYTLQNAHALPVFNFDFFDFRWTNGSGITYPFELCYVKPTPDIFYLWHDRSILTQDRLKELESHLASDVYPDLNVELLLDARAALEERNNRRAIIEGAVACETGVKSAFFGFGTVASETFEYLEERGKANVPVPQFLHSIAKRVFGHSFKEENSAEYQAIEDLFRARNKAAHRGLGYLRNEQGEISIVDDKVVGNWLNAVEAVFRWLEKVQASIWEEDRNS